MDYPDEAAERLVIRGNLRGLEVARIQPVRNLRRGRQENTRGKTKGATVCTGAPFCLF